MASTEQFTLFGAVVGQVADHEKCELFKGVM